MIRLGLMAAIAAFGAGLGPPAAFQAMDGYADYATFRARVLELDASERVAVTSLGKTLGEREIYLLTVGMGTPDEKPAIAILGSVHAPHLAGSELAVRMARLLSEREELLQRVTFYVIPRPNPDASEAAFRKPYADRDANERETDDDRDGESGEDPPQDLNGDGWITLMRVEDETGTHMPHAKDPRVLIPADSKKNEKGRYVIHTEGRDSDRDGQWNEDGPGGVSFNRNFTFRYPFFKPGAGPHQVSEIETRAVADFLFSRTNVAAVFSFSPEDNLMHPWKGGTPEQDKARIRTAVASGDGPIFEYIAGEYQKIHGGKNAPEPPKGEGSFSEWAYYHYGRWSFAARGWWIPSPEPEKKEDAPPEAKGKPPRKSEDKRGDDLVQALQWFDQNKIDGFVPWTPIEHSDFPHKKVDVGGFKPFYLLNPPAKELDSLAAKHADFAARLAELLPRLAIHEAKVEKLNAGVFRVTATVANTGYLPTLSDMGAATRELQPLQIRIDLPQGVSIADGTARRRMDTLGGNGGKQEISWLLVAQSAGPHQATLTVWSPPVGTDSKTINLE
ncbi:MAG: hypothetical protein HY716_07425 [Planctomycetes bacterium]|nr:hypothetical protein [Planctomycetota bacterium]